MKGIMHKPVSMEKNWRHIHPWCNFPDVYGELCSCFCQIILKNKE